MNDAGHESVGQALLISGVAVGAFAVAELGNFVLGTFDQLIAALS